MLIREIGKTGLMSTEMIFGALPISPLQLGLDPDIGASLVCKALRSGINHVDAAEGYRVGPVLERVAKDYGNDFLLSYKSHAATYEDMAKSIESVLRLMGREALDVMYLHAAKEPALFTKRAGALECLIDYKKKGLVRAIGVSSHVVPLIHEAAGKEEIDLVFALLNKAGLGLMGGTSEDLDAALQLAHKNEKGIVAMKVLGGGLLLTSFIEAINYARTYPGISAVALGMVNEKELDINLRIFNGETVDEEELAPVRHTKKLMINRQCRGCGDCVSVCPSDALSLVDGNAVVDNTKCLLCGYCNPVCPNFALRIV